MKIDYQYKHKVLNQFPDLDIHIRAICRAVYVFCVSNDIDDPIVKKGLELAKKYYYDPLKVITTNKVNSEALIRYPYYKPILEVIRLNNAYYARKRRLQLHVNKMFSKGICLFLTLTFRDDVLESTSFKTRRQYVHRFLKSLSSSYVANIDFGDLKEREHYHAIVLLDRYKVGSWKYGYDYVEVCNSTILDEVRLSKYVSKLTNHAYKKSGRRYSIIYSKSI